MKTSKAGVLELLSHEGIVLGPYLDSAGVWTYGVGHTRNAGGLDPEKLPRGFDPKQEALELRRAVSVFEDDLRKYEARVLDAVKVPLTQAQFDALVSFDFNTGGIHRADLTKKLNAGRSVAEVAQAFFGWVRPPEIRARRTRESRLFLTGGYTAALGVPVYVPSSSNRPKFYKSLSADEVLGLTLAFTPTPTPRPASVPSPTPTQPVSSAAVDPAPTTVPLTLWQRFLLWLS